MVSWPGTQNGSMRPYPAAATLSAAILLVMTACGADDGGELGGAGSDGDLSAHDSGGEGPAGHTMSETDATRADELEGAELREGAYAVLDTAPPGSEDVTGRVWVAQNDEGTTVTTQLSGLEPGTDYLMHLHEQPCSQDDGGDHFRFDPEGSEEPPNEIHLAFTADAEGVGEATVTNDRRVEDAARSIVIHPADAMDNRLACADF